MGVVSMAPSCLALQANQDGAVDKIAVHGNSQHCFYTGDVMDGLRL